MPVIKYIYLCKIITKKHFIMKKIFYYALFVALMLSTITSCGPDQSELNLETFATKAVISGTLFYDAGVNLFDESAGNAPNYSVDSYTPLSGQKVYLEVEYDQYVDNNTGTKVYETETDTLGTWLFEIPTTMEGVNVRVYMEKLRTFKTSYKEMDGDTPIVETLLYEYTYETTSTLKPNDKVILPPQSLTGEKVNDIAGFEEQITLKGNIQQAYETGYREGAYMPAANMPVEFKIGYEGLDPITFGTATDSTGSYTIVLPLRSFEEGFRSLEINPKETYSKYQHFSAPGQTMTLAGKYKAEPFSRGVLEDFTEKEYTMPTMHMIFDPNYSDGFTMTTVPASWPNGVLAGWLYVDDQKTTTEIVSGKSLLAVENGYCEGEYVPAQEIILNVTYLGSTERVYVNADADGNFHFELPVKENSTTEPRISVVNLDAEFTHYSVSGEKDIQGTYRGAINNEEEEWNELGTIYNKFVPESRPDDWQENLVGWLHSDAQKTNTGIVSGKLLYAEETGFCIGGYTVKPNQAVILNIDGTDVCVATDAEGKFSFELPIEKNAEPEIRVGSLVGEFTFTHYFRKETKDKELKIQSKEIDGSYVYLSSTDKGEWNELGTIYCGFRPESQLDDWYANLAGWAVGEKLSSKNVSGTILVAKESGFRAGIYEGVPYQPVTITIVDGGTRSFVGATDKTGKYNIGVLVRYPDEGPSLITVTPDFGSSMIMTHYRRPDNSTTEEVEVRCGRGFSSYIEGLNAWYERGENYYPVSAVNAGSVTNWSENLVGWLTKKQEVESRYTKTLKISGVVKRAVEESEVGIWTEKWEKDPYRLVRAIVDGTAYDIATQNNGSFSFSIRVPETEKDGDTHNVTIIPQEDEKDVAFKHHADKRGNAMEYITGKYYSAENIKNTDIVSKNDEINIETSAKMLFRPATTPQGWSEYNWDLTEK